jgi:hypothetical protein
MLWYLAWRVATGLHKTITLNFLVAGHTKFAPDWCFGLLKQAFRRHAITVTVLPGEGRELKCAVEQSPVGGEGGWNFFRPRVQLAGSPQGALNCPAFHPEISSLQVTWWICSFDACNLLNVS